MQVAHGSYNPPVIARVHVPDASAAVGPIAVSEDEARWLRDVLRVRSGDAVRAFDGRGQEWEAAIAAQGRRGVTLTLGAARTPQPEPLVRYTVVVPALKGDAADDVVRDAVMMGAAAIVPLVSDRTEVTLAALTRGHRQARWQRVAIASAKQCGRAVVPVIEAPIAFDALAALDVGATRLLFVEPGIATSVMSVAAVPRPNAAVLASGPEGGWTDREVATAVAAGWQPVRLGSRVLRANAAPLVAMAACQAVWQDA